MLNLNLDLSNRGQPMNQDHEEGLVQRRDFGASSEQKGRIATALQHILRGIAQKTAARRGLLLTNMFSMLGGRQLCEIHLGRGRDTPCESRCVSCTMQTIQSIGAEPWW